MVIHSHDNLQPVLVSEPCNWGGLTGKYWPATPEGARQAMEYHEKHWADWEVDQDIVSLANE